MRTVLLSSIAVLALTGSAAAHPGHGGGGPPSTVTMGPPSAAFSHVPNGVANGQNAGGAANDANLLGNLNAAHASASALAHASPNSIVGKLAIYKGQLTTALANEQAAQTAVNNDNTRINNDNAIINNPASSAADVANAKADLALAQTQLGIDQTTLANAQKAVANVEASLSNFANKTVTPAVIARVNTLLGVQ